MKKILILLVCLTLLVGCGKNEVENVMPTVPEMPQEQYQGKVVNLYVFYGMGCPHCENLFDFLDNLDTEYKQYFKLKKYETWQNEDNYDLMKKAALKFNEQAGGVPYYIIGDKTFKGYNHTFDNKIKEELKKQYYNENLVDVMEHLN